jgi:hypothetical protein
MYHSPIAVPRIGRAVKLWQPSCPRICFRNLEGFNAWLSDYPRCGFNVIVSELQYNMKLQFACSRSIQFSWSINKSMDVVKPTSQRLQPYQTHFQPPSFLSHVNIPQPSSHMELVKLCHPLRNPYRTTPLASNPLHLRDTISKADLSLVGISCVDAR